MIKNVVVAMVVCAFPCSVWAQAHDTAQSLGVVVISATKVPRPANTLTQAVTVISGDDLRARGVERVSDALREVPGASLVQSGSFGAVTSLFLRGGESRYTKVLVDGVAVNSAGGYFDFSHLTTDNIERIEIVRGPASVLYGADAVSGVVQIFTRKPGAQNRASIGLRGGTYGSLDVDGDATSSVDRVGYSLGGAHHRTNGILPFNNQYTNGTLSSALKLANGPEGEVKLTARYTAAEFHYPTDFVGQVVDTNSYRTQHRLTVGVDATHNFGANVQGRVLAGDNDVHDLTEDVAVPFGATDPAHSASRSLGFRRSIEGRVAVFLPASATLTVGSAYETEHEHSSNSSGPVGGTQAETDSFDATRHNTAYYSEVVGSVLDRVSYTLSGRVDNNSDYDQYGTYRLGANVVVFRNVRVRGSLASAFNAPAFSQLRPTLFTTASPDLRPEKSRAAEVGVSVGPNTGLFSLSGNYFQQRFSDLIQYVPGSAPDFRGSYANLTGATSNGYEAEAAATPTNAISVSASYTVVTPRVREIPAGYQGSDQVGDELIRRPTHSGRATLSYRRHAASVGAAVSYVGKRADMDFAQFPSPRVSLPAYSRVDLSAEAPLTRLGAGHLVLNARIENLFDKKYEEVLHFPAPRRTILIGARASNVF